MQIAGNILREYKHKIGELKKPQKTPNNWGIKQGTSKLFIKSLRHKTRYKPKYKMQGHNPEQKNQRKHKKIKDVLECGLCSQI